MKGSYQIITAPVETNGGKSHTEILLGGGDYAQVYLARVRSDEQTSSARKEVAAKLYNDEADQDMGDVFMQEVQHLRALGWHEHIVGLRGVDEHYPPTFVCEECGDAFHRTECPDCGSVLENVTSQHVFPSLQCSGAQTHEFAKNRVSDIEKLSRDRPCGHKGATHPVNFLFRPCLFLDVLDLNLSELQELLKNDETEIRKHRVARVGTADDWQRQTFLTYLWCLYQASEGLAHIHLSGRLHGDLSPQNIMVSLSPCLHQSGLGAYPIRNTCLIDLGEARPAMEVFISRPPKVKRNYAAPERTQLKSSIQGPVTILPQNGSFKRDQLCTMLTPISAENDLFPGDLVRDQFGGEYALEQREGAQNGRSQFVLRILKPPSLNKPAIATNFQINMDAGTRLPIDLYAFGSVAASLLCGGRIPILQMLQTTAREASEVQEDVNDRFLENFLRPQNRERLMQALSLPDTAEDQGIRERVLLLIFRCLVRGPGAYVNSRSATDVEATTRLVRDLRLIYDDMHFLHQAKQRMTIWMAKEHARYQESERRSSHLVEQLEAQGKLLRGFSEELDAKNTKSKADAKLLDVMHNQRVLTTARLHEESKRLEGANAELHQRDTELAAKTKAVLDLASALESCTEQNRQWRAAFAVVSQDRDALKNQLASWSGFWASLPASVNRLWRTQTFRAMKRPSLILLLFSMLCFGGFFLARWYETNLGTQKIPSSTTAISVWGHK